MYVIVILLVVLAIYGLAYVFYGKKILEQKVVKASPERLTPAYERFDGIDYVPANKYVLFGHHFASIAGAGPIVGPATAMVWGWGLPLIWVLFGNIFIGAVHDYLAIMASVRHGGLSIMSISEGVMGRKAKYIFLAYVWFALVLVLAAFLSVASSTFVAVPTAATISVLFMPIALLFGMLVYRTGVSVKTGTLIALVLLVLAFFYSLNTPLYLTYEAWVVVLTLYSILAAALPVWYLLQPRDYINAYMLWTFVALAILGALIIPELMFTGPIYTGFAAPGTVIGALPGTSAGKALTAYFWPTVPLVIACGALSGFHSVVGSGTTSKQLANELDALLVGYGGMLTEGAVSSLAVITPIALAWSFASLQAATGAPIASALLKVGINATKTPVITGLAAAERFYTGYGIEQALAWSRVFGATYFETFFVTFRTFAAWALSGFVLTTLDTSNRLARFAWREFFDWVKPRSESAYKALTNRWVASIVAVVIGALMAYPKITVYIPETGQTLTVYAYSVVWPAFAGTNQLLAALALLTGALWVYAILKVRGGISWLIMVPAMFLWVTVTAGLIWWMIAVVPGLPTLYQIGAGSIVAVSIVLDFLLIGLFVAGLRRAK
ncbi:MAG: carbon starvation protein A [Zestosphaera tikiterensis]|uniref:Carbon starvation protein A n=1 Tax=Zestosphaera tikiterensis TaxID=1973259 RepID=A0A2R7Y7X2_9CREN|nr:MAG: carbon starvation protein A [Zestosphaera tikiterensis]